MRCYTERKEKVNNNNNEPFNPSDEENQVAVDLGAVDELVDVARVDGLRRV